ncbi:hypothetical protein Dimus_034678 [Dionaea muscipula]
MRSISGGGDSEFRFSTSGRPSRFSMALRRKGSASGAVELVAFSIKDLQLSLTAVLSCRWSRSSLRVVDCRGGTIGVRVS